MAIMVKHEFGGAIDCIVRSKVLSSKGEIMKI